MENRGNITELLSGESTAYFRDILTAHCTSSGVLLDEHIDVTNLIIFWSISSNSVLG